MAFNPADYVEAALARGEKPSITVVIQPGGSFDVGAYVAQELARGIKPAIVVHADGTGGTTPTPDIYNTLSNSALKGSDVSGFMAAAQSVADQLNALGA